MSLWVFVTFVCNPPLDKPDGHAIVTGDCGDTMEISFGLKNGRVYQTHHSTTGCGFSKKSIEAAALLIKDKTPSEIELITPQEIQKKTGEIISNTHQHCILLAELTLKSALDDYERKS